MGMPAARAGDMHVCPMVDVLVPHVGGPILPPGCPTVLIGSMPAARVGDMATCVGPPDTIRAGLVHHTHRQDARRTPRRPHRPRRNNRPRLPDRIDWLSSGPQGV